MNLERVEKIAEAVLYEGYMLYPYRASAVKNQQRWNFGVLCPRSYSEIQNGTEAWSMQTECLLEGEVSARLSVKVRFLQIVNRTVGKLARPLRDLPDGVEPDFELVDRLEVGGQTYTSWREAVEREVAVPPVHAAATLFYRPMLFDFPAGTTFESVRDESGMIAGIIVREWQAVSGAVEIDGRECEQGVAKISVRVQNTSASVSTHQQTRADALMYSMVSAHTILGLEDGEFVSLLDPPEKLRSLADECRNLGTWPVLVGDEGDRDTMLSSPIILYDYPQIAPESSGALFDGTEIDEILSLRVLTLTDEEKREMGHSDQRTREILERTESMPPEHFMKMHGVMRGLRPQAEEAP
jgi:hydrogenase maturation protease